MRFTAAAQRAKLATLMEIGGYDSIEDLAQAILSDSVSPAICMNEGCATRPRWSQTRTPATARSVAPTRCSRHSSSPASSNSAVELLNTALRLIVRGLFFCLTSGYKRQRS